MKGYEATQWYGILAPAKVPKPYIDKLNAAIVKVLHSPETKALLSREAAEPVGNSPEEFGRFIKSEMARWAPVVKQSGAKVEWPLRRRRPPSRRRDHRHGGMSTLDAARARPRD